MAEQSFGCQTIFRFVEMQGKCLITKAVFDERCCLWSVDAHAALFEF